MSETEWDGSLDLPEDEDAEAPEGQPEAEAEPDAEQAPEQEEGQPEQAELLAGKYRSPEDLENAYLELQRTQGSMAQELGELRKLQQQQFDWQREQAVPQPDYETLIEEDPRTAIDAAAARNDEAGIDRAWVAWYEIDPGPAQLWREKYNTARMEQRLQQMQQPLLQQSQSVEKQQKVGEFVRAHPDFSEHAPQMDEIIRGMPFLAALAESGDPSAEVEALNVSYELAKARKMATLHGATTEIARTQAQAAEEALSDAYVASSSTTVREAPEPTLADQLTEGWGRSGLHWGE